MQQRMQQTDKLEKMFELRKIFMRRIKDLKHDEYPDWPIDIRDKKPQQHVRDMALRGVEEMFEALQHFKNWKPHRDAEVRDFDRAAFLEEIVDAFNYFFSVLVLTGISGDELFEAYVKKDEIIHRRLSDGY